MLNNRKDILESLMLEKRGLRNNKEDIKVPWNSFKSISVDKSELDKETDLNDIDESTLLNTQEEFFKTTPQKVVYSSTSIFSERFIELLKERLGTADGFKKKTTQQKRQIAKNIQSILLTEYIWKGLVSKSKYEKNIISEIFPNEKDHFHRLFKQMFFPQRKTHKKRVDNKYASAKCANFYVSVSHYLKENNVFFFKEFEAFTPNQSTFKRLENEISSDYFFGDIIKLCMKKAFDNSINIESKNSKDFYEKTLEGDFLYVKRRDLLHSVQVCVVLYLINQLIDHIMDNKKEMIVHSDFTPQRIALRSLPDKKDVLMYVHNLIKEKKFSLEKHSWYCDTYDIAHVLILLFCETDVVKKVEQINVYKRGHKTSTILWLSHKLKDTIPFSHHLPLITPPSILDAKKNSETFIKPIKGGTSSMSISKEAIDALNIAQKKKFGINVVFRDYMDLIHHDPRTIGIFTETPFPTEWSIETCKNERDMWNRNLIGNSLQRLTYSRAYGFLSVQKKTGKLKKDSLFYAMDTTYIEQDLYMQTKELSVSYRKGLAKKQLLNTSLTISEIYEGFPIFYGTKLDYRTRMYPWEFLLSRTTGELKHLLCDYKAEKLTIQGLINFMVAAYRWSLNDTLKLLESFDPKKTYSNKKTGKILLKKLFNERNIFKALEGSEQINLKKKGCYFLSLHHEIQRIFSTNSMNTSLNVEIDQSASGMVLLSLLLGNMKMAKHCNLIDSEPKDVYEFVMQNIPSYFENATYTKHIPDESGFLREVKKPFDKGVVLNFLSENRSVQKGALMRWCYSEGDLSRRNKWLEEFLDIYNRRASDSEFETLNAFSAQYDLFLERLFPKLLSQKAIMIKVLKIRYFALYTSDFLSVSIKTLDKCSLAWDYTPVVEKTMSVYNPITGKSLSYKIYVENNEDGRAESNRLKSLTTSFFPNLIHSIDAALMRKIIRTIHEQTGYTINHVHDCVILHPNYVNTFYDVVEDVYTSDFMKDLAKKCFFEPMKESLADDFIKEINELQEKFELNAYDIRIEKGKFDARNMYVFEGSVSNKEVYLAQKNKKSELIK